MQDQGRYTVCAEIACGSTATVYLAEDKVLRRKVALKRLHPHLLGHSETVKRFRKEAVAIASLSHENIIQVYDYGDQERDLYLAMEYVDGASLESLLAVPTRILPSLAGLSILHQLLKGLTAAHESGVVHRDVKPSNLLVDRKGCVRIADFGIAFLAEENAITKTGSYLGTPVYSSPEQADGLPATAKSDVFSSGIVLYRCFTGRLPFQGENSHAILKAIVELHPRKPATLNRRMFAGLSELILAMLSKAPDKRPTAADCAAELAALAARAGFELGPERVRRFVADPTGYPEAERSEIGAYFMGLARQAREGGESRKAVKLEAQAELHSAAATLMELDTVAASALRRWNRPSLAAGAVAAACCLAGIAWITARAALRAPSEAEAAAGTAVAPAGIPASPAAGTGPAEPSPAASVPAEVTAELPSSAGYAVEVPASRPSPSAPPALKAASAVATPLEGPSSPAAAEAAPAAKEAAAPGSLVVKSNPPFAAVSVDGRQKGHTPFKAPLELAAGEHEIVLEREGCLPHSQTFRVESGKTTVLRLTLERAEVAVP